MARKRIHIPRTLLGGLLALVLAGPGNGLTDGRLLANEGLVGDEVKAQIETERGLKLNERYLHTINPAVSNLGTDEEKQAFRRAVHRHMRSEILYRAFQFNAAYRELQKSQLLLIQLFERTIDRDRRLVHARLAGFARRALYEQNHPRVRKYLQLGLRDLEMARIKYVKQANRHPNLHQIRLTHLEDALKLVRHANRYWVLLAIELESVARAENPETIDFASGRLLLASGFFGEERSEKLLLHYDNFFRVAPENESLYDVYWNDPDFTHLTEERDLPGWVERPEDTLRVQPALGGPGHYAPRRLPEDYTDYDDARPQSFGVAEPDAE